MQQPQQHLRPHYDPVVELKKPTAYIEQPSIGTQFLNKSPTGKSSGQDVLLPLATNENRYETVTTVCVSSRDRNVITFPNPNFFRWRFKRNLKNIQSIRLIGGSVPGKLYNINTGWNQFTFLENNIKYTCTLIPGVYDGTSISTELKRALNSIVGISNSYNVVYSATTLKLTITRSSGTYNYSLLFQTGTYTDKFDDFRGAVDSISNDYLSMINTPARVLGFVSIDYSDISGIIVAPYPVDVGSFTNKIYLYVGADTSNELNNVELGRGSHDPYSILYLDTELNGTKFLNKETDYPLLQFNPTSLSRISSLEISLRDEFYRLMDLGNKEFSLLFEIIHLA